MTDFNLVALTDVFVVSVLMYLVLMLLKRTRSYYVFGDVIMLGILYYLSFKLHLFLTALILQYFSGFLIFILVIVFQRELRNFFEWIFVLGVFGRSKREPLSALTSREIVESLSYLKKKKIGALVVLTGSQPLDRFLEGGFELGGKLSTPLLLSIFDASSPGHDGAVVVKGDLVQRFGVHLPLAENFAEHRDLGTRHRSGLGLSERTDALVVIVSEERGTISLARHGKLSEITDAKELETELHEFLAEDEPRHTEWYRFISQNFQEKLFAISIAAILWFIIVYKTVTN